MLLQPSSPSWVGIFGSSGRLAGRRRCCCELSVLTARCQALRRYQTARGKLMMQRQRAIQALRSPLEHFTELSHAPTCLGNGSICGDEVIDLPDHMVGENQGDVVFPAEQIVPYMYRGNTYQLRNMMGNVVYGAYQPGYAPYGQFAKAPTTMLAQKNLGDEVRGGGTLRETETMAGDVWE
eukprot:768649-Hanusia_phi.AAC.4